jgi:hypothetical protein
VNKSSEPRFIVVTTLAHLAAPAVIICLLEFYTHVHSGKEAWPILFPALITAFSLQIVILFLALRHQRGAAFLFKISIAVLVSWATGLAGFLVLDIFARSLFSKPPLFAWLLSLAMLFVMMKRAERT